MEFMEQSGDLNELENYPQLLYRCNIIGVNVKRVVFRGYFAAPELQALHEKTITKHAELELEVSDYIYVMRRVIHNTPLLEEGLLVGGAEAWTESVSTTKIWFCLFVFWYIKQGLITQAHIRGRLVPLTQWQFL